jgi:monoamine oxidase
MPPAIVQKIHFSPKLSPNREFIL